MDKADFDPHVIESCPVKGGHFELVEWHWPAMVSFERVEQKLMLEMSLPPMAADASAVFPAIDPDRRCFMGALFARYPGIILGGRSEGGQIRVMRVVFDEDEGKAILNAGDSAPTLAFLQGLLNIRNETLRHLMRMAHRELVNPIDRSQSAMEGFFAIAKVELRRLFRQAEAEGTSRLAPWQFRRIRERIESDAPMPDVAELADLCGISRRHLHRQFVALTGTTVSSYIEACRMEDAKQMLIRHDMPVKQIAQQAGYGHMNSFARAFRRATGLSPRAFRQRLRGAEEPTSQER